MDSFTPDPMSTPQPPRPFSLAGKLAFGAGDIGPGMTANLLAFSFLIFLTTTAGLSPVAAGSVLAIGRVWDAVNDPLIGYLSDNTRSRWGRRYPWIALGALPFGLTFFLTWIVPGFQSEGARFWYYVIMSLLFQVFYTVVNLPYTTLTAELSKNYDERTELTAFRLGSSLTGAISALALGLVVSNLIQDSRQQYLVLAAVCSVLSVLPLLWCVVGTYPYAVERNALQPATDPNAAENLPFLQQIKIALSNRAFLFVVGIYLFAWLALQMTASVIPFYTTFWMGMDSYFLAALLVQGTAIAMMVAINYLSRRYGKQEACYAGSGTWIWIWVPWPGVEEHSTRPPIASAAWRTSANPSPSPPCRRVIELSDCHIGESASASRSGGMPSPVSETASLQQSPSLQCSAERVIWPSRVKRTALSSSASSARASHTRSPVTRLSPGGETSLAWLWLCSRSGLKAASRSSSSSRSEKGAFSSSMSPV